MLLFEYRYSEGSGPLSKRYLVIKRGLGLSARLWCCLGPMDDIPANLLLMQDRGWVANEKPRPLTEYFEGDDAQIDAFFSSRNFTVRVEGSGSKESLYRVVFQRTYVDMLVKSFNKLSESVIIPPVSRKKLDDV